MFWSLRIIDRPAPEDPDRGSKREYRGAEEALRSLAEHAFAAHDRGDDTPEGMGHWADVGTALTCAANAIDRLRRSRPSSGDGEAVADPVDLAALGRIVEHTDGMKCTIELSQDEVDRLARLHAELADRPTQDEGEEVGDET